ncbi:MAG: hypothetical protein V8R94_03535 [Lachnospiraceae bacterium]
MIGWSYTFLAALFGWVLSGRTRSQAGGMMSDDLSVEVFQTDVLLQNIVDHRAFVMLIVGFWDAVLFRKYGSGYRERNAGSIPLEKRYGVQSLRVESGGAGWKYL